MILLNPGPVTLSNSVRQALLQPDLCHREPEFFALQRQVREQLLSVYSLAASDWAAVMLSGSGTAAVEAMLTSLVPADGKLLVLENGVYGERMARIAALHHIDCLRLSHAWGAPLDLARLQMLLEQEPQISHLAVVQHETTTGRLNDLDSVAALCRRYQVKMLVDGVSSFGAEAIDFDDWPLAAVAATANKCLHGIPGLAFVIASRADVSTGCQPPRTLYLDLLDYLDKQDADSTPFTPAVPAYYALHQALTELQQQGGWRTRHQHYLSLAEQVHDGLQRLDIHPYLAPPDCSVVLRGYRFPPGISYVQLHDHLKRHGFVIYAGQGGLEKQVFRISTMGEISTADIDRLLDAFELLLHREARQRVNNDQD